MLGLRLRQLRKEKSLTLQLVAQELGVTRACVSKWETGVSKPDLDRLGALATVLGVSASDLFSASAPPGSSSTLSGYPVISLVNGLTIQELIASSSLRQPSPRLVSSRAFFVALEGYMVAHFGLTGVPREALLLVDPETNANSGDLVLIHSRSLGYQVLAVRDKGGQLEHVSLGIKLSHLGPISDAAFLGVVLESVNTQGLRGFALRHAPQLLFA